MMDDIEDPKDEKIFELNQEIKRLSDLKTYLQHELASVEDDMMTMRKHYEAKIAELEQELGDALNHRGMC